MTTQQPKKKQYMNLVLRGITGITLIALAVIMGMIYGPLGTSQSALAQSVFLLVATTALYSACMIYALFVVATREKKGKKPVSKEAAKADDRLLIEWLILIGGVVVVAMLALVPALAMGIFTTDNTSTGQAVTILYLMILMGLLFGPLIAAGVFAPITLLVSGTVALLKGDRSKVGQLRLGAMITVLTTFCLATGLAIHPYFSGIGGWSLIILGILGIPGAYDVKNEPLLWVARIVLAIAIVALIVSLSLSKKTKK